MPKTKSNTSRSKRLSRDDDHHVTFKLTQPYAAFKTIVTSSNLYCLGQRSQQQESLTVILRQCSPDRGEVHSYRVGSERSLHPCPKETKITGVMPIATTITCRVIPEGSARAIALEAGRGRSCMENVDAHRLCANIEANPDVTLLEPDDLLPSNISV